MTPTEIRAYMETHRRATLADLANHFRTSEDVLRPMVQLWVNKGRARIEEPAKGCNKGCGSCGCMPDIVTWLPSD